MVCYDTLYFIYVEAIYELFHGANNDYKIYDFKINSLWTLTFNVKKRFRNGEHNTIERIKEADYSGIRRRDELRIKERENPNNFCS